MAGPGLLGPLGMDPAYLSSDDASSDISSLSSSRSTVTGIGMMSGKAIKAIGSLALDGVAGAHIHGRLAWMWMQLRADRQHIPMKVYEHVMELQR